MAMEGAARDELVSKTSQLKRTVIFAFSALCLGSSLVIFLSLLFRFFFFKPCPKCRRRNGTFTDEAFGGVGFMLFILGTYTLIHLYYKKRRDISSHLTPQVIVSEIPTEDINKSPAYVLPYNHKPYCHQSIVEWIDSNIDLPDYFSAVQHSDHSEDASFRDPPDYFTIYNYEEQIETSIDEPPDYFTVVQVNEMDLGLGQ